MPKFHGLAIFYNFYLHFLNIMHVLPLKNLLKKFKKFSHHHHPSHSLLIFCICLEPIIWMKIEKWPNLSMKQRSYRLRGRKVWWRFTLFLVFPNGRSFDCWHVEQQMGIIFHSFVISHLAIFRSQSFEVQFSG